MSASSVVLKKLNHLVQERLPDLATLSLLSKIEVAPLTRKLAGHGEFTVAELSQVCRVLGYSVSVLFAEATIKQKKPCNVAACVEQEHRYENGTKVENCCLEIVEIGQFRVLGTLSDEGEWIAWPDISHDVADGWEGVKQLREIAKELEAMQARCDKLNGKTLERRTEPGSPRFEEAV